KLEKFADRVRWVESSACLVKGCAMDRTDRTDRTDQTDQTGRRRGGVCGVIFCNELLDSFPVHRWAWDATARIWFAWGVTLQKPAGASKSDFTPGHQFAWQKIPIEAGFAAAELEQAALQVPAEILAVLPDGFIIEVCPEARDWWCQVALALKKGKLLTIDYGF